ncbi:MAG: leucyl-tRNA synthetase [Bacteriovoracaceae bacterium]
MKYDYNKIEPKWQKYWEENQTFKVTEDKTKPKYYVLDMFPYPSGAGLHVGHPLGYIASDIYTRYKRAKGFNVLHPMGFDAFGLPAEQYAIQTGQHPAVTTENNIKRYREQFDRIGFSFDWSREVRTCDPSYYKHTQWAFIKMFDSWYDKEHNKARPISDLIAAFESHGNKSINASCAETPTFSGSEWKRFSESEQQKILLNYRIAFLADTTVNWCPALGTVLANDEVKDGLSERGDHPVEQKVMKQWSLRISAYAQRLLEGLDHVEWSESIKEQQRNWIGRSEGAEVLFKVKDSKVNFEIFTTRPDTMFGVTFMVLAPESELVQQVTTEKQKSEVEAYLEVVKKKTDRDRLADVKNVTGVFSGAYCVHPFSGDEIPIWIGDYVLGGYGTGAIMAVPAHDSRDYAFAKEFNIPITEVVSGGDISKESYDAKEGKLVNSDFLNGLEVKEAIKKMNHEVEARGLGKKKINYRLRDAIFARQRYWGEPLPVYFKDGLPYTLKESELPLELPEVDAYLPTKEGDPPLARAEGWEFELSTMPGFAGSSAYYLRYMDPHNKKELASRESMDYWKSVDLYVGGSEHATGHLIYSRFWNKFLFDLGYSVVKEPFKKLVNQGMIQGRSNFVYRVKGSNQFVSHGLKDKYDTTELHVDVNIVDNDYLDMEAFKTWLPDYKDAEFITEEIDGTQKYKCGFATEKMSKSKWNVVNPDIICERYGADTLRLYEMFLGPIEQAKPWNTNGIEGVHRFLKKFWGLFYDQEEKLLLNEEEPTDQELKILHKTIKKASEDMENFSFNTSISAFMIALNELPKGCHKRAILEPLTILLAPFAPHQAEELWSVLGHEESITHAAWPEFNESFLTESTYKYPVSFNGKMRYLLDLDINLNKEQIEKAILEHENSQKYLDGKTIKKVIIVPKKIVNIVVG